MNKKIIIIIVSAIIILICMIVLSMVIPEYKKLDSDNISYKYVDSYNEYIDFTHDVKRKRELKESDFDGSKKYLVYIVNIDSSIEVVEEENTTKVYFDKITKCNSNPVAYAVEITKDSNYVEMYYKLRGNNSCLKAGK